MNKEDLTLETLQKYRTVPYDPRFPNTNQTRNCYQNYVDFHRCSKVRGEDYEACRYFKRVYQILCPNAWIEKWDEQIAEDRFPGNI
ncbi:cytochrome c oxidase subunit 6B1-like [Diachasmimorpha longicaudata]|uniref:cytochrome c oxidase subunit 6B1-like n=1 Tax=Diachasmimorpha longicaudata TaxID=58733 RepID=UPI0030B8B0A3